MSSKKTKELSIKWIQDKEKDFPFYRSEDRKYYIRLSSVRSWSVHAVAPQGDEEFYLCSKFTLRDAKKVVSEIENAVDPRAAMKELILGNPFVMDEVKPEIIGRFTHAFETKEYTAMSSMPAELTAKDVAMKILRNSGCTEQSYQGDPIDLILKDLTVAFPDEIEGGFSHNEIAEAIYAISTTDRNWKEPIKFDTNGRDASHCGATDLYEWVEESLRKIVDSGEPFQTCHLCSKKELLSWQMSRVLTNGEITLTVNQWMDEGTALVYDALSDDIVLSEKQMEEIVDAWILGCDGRSETSKSIVVSGDSTLDQILEKVSDLVAETDATLTELFDLMKGTIREYLERKGDSGDEFSLYASQPQDKASLDFQIKTASAHAAESQSTHFCKVTKPEPEF